MKTTLRTNNSLCFPLILLLFTVVGCEKMPAASLNPEHFSSNSLEKLNTSVKKLSNVQIDKVVNTLSCKESLESKFPKFSFADSSPVQLRSLAQNADTKNQKLYFGMLELAKSRDHENFSVRLNEVKESLNVDYRYVQLTDADMKTWFSNQLLQNLIGLFEFQHRFGHAEINTSDVVEYLKARAAFIPLVEQEFMGADVVDASVRNRIWVFMNSNLNKAINEGLVHAEWHYDGVSFLTLYDGETTHSLTKRGWSDPEWVSGEEALAAFNRAHESIDFAELGISDLAEAMSIALLRECKRYEYRASVQSTLSDIEALESAFRTNQTAEFLTEYASNKVVNSALSEIQKSIPVRISTKFSGEDAILELNSPCGFTSELASFKHSAGV